MKGQTGMQKTSQNGVTYAKQNLGNVVSQTQNRPIPGLTVAYGSQAQQTTLQAPQPARSTQPAGGGLFFRLKDRLFNMVTEDSAKLSERPIGLSQLTQVTFQANPYGPASNFFKNSQPVQDYRYKPLTEPGFQNLYR
jgi:hypothetical protein